MKAYSSDLRVRVYAAYTLREDTVAEIAKQFEVSEGFIYKLAQQMETLGHLEALPHGGGHPPPLSPEQEELVRLWVAEKPDSTLAELCARCRKEIKAKLHLSTMCRLLQKLNLPRKKKSFVPNEADPKKQEAFLENVNESLAAEDLISVDETGVNLDLARGYGRAEPGQRVKEERPVNTPINTTLIGALGVKGMVSSMTMEGAADGEIFCRFVEEMLAPRLKPGQVVLLDNVAIHKSPRVNRAIEARGATLLYIPAYSPQLNPIDECWSKIKTTLRSIAARTQQRLRWALKQALTQITQSDVRGWFEHAGYIFTPKCNAL